MQFNRQLAYVSILALIIASPAFAKNAKPYKAKFDPAKINEIVKTVSSDEFEGRGVGTPAETKTIDFIASRMAQYDVLPGGDNGTWFQDVQLRRFSVENANIVANLGGTTKPLEISKDITVSTRAAMSNLNFKDVPLVFVGYGTNAPERSWNDFKDANGKPIDVKGKFIVVLINDADFHEPKLNTFNGKAMTYYGRWTYKFEEAARQGALGCLIVHEDDAASYGWATVKNSNNGKKLDIVREDPTKASPLLESWISYDFAKELFKAGGLDLDAEKKAARSANFAAKELKNISFSGGFDVKTETIKSHNVVGILKGQTRPDEFIVYGAHWDHLGIGLPDAKGDKIFNGALDNGTGIASLIEMAGNFAKAPKRDRSVVFIAFTAEESGLLGSEFYASNPIYPLEKTVLGVNMDGLNIFGRTKDVEIVGWNQSGLQNDIIKIAKTQDRIVKPEGSPEAGGFFRSDHFPFVKRGVPFVNAGSGSDLRIGGKKAGEKASKEYTTNNYHQPSDEWSPNWNLSGAVEDLQIYFTIGHEFTNSSKWPKWNAGSEFKAVRDKTENLRK